jgi:LAGLIDADG DNA endonuclease family
VSTKKLQSQIPKFSKQVLLGTLLGDGSIGYSNPGVSKNARFQMRHSIEQSEWFHWKAQVFTDLATEKAIHIQEPDGFSKNQKLHFQTQSLPCLTPYRQWIYPNDIKRVNQQWLNQIGPIGLMVMWLDDGGLTGEGNRKARIQTKGFTLEENQLISNWLKTKWGIDNKIQKVTDKKTGRTYFVIDIYQEATKNFLNIFMKHNPCESMVYKFFMCYKDQKLQQSWISEMKTAMPQFNHKIDELLKNSSENDIVHN